MPKQVDYESRRRRIAEAVCLLADERGPEGVSMRDVAARAQVSLGAVQRCFRSKAEMLLFAVDHVGDRITERVRTRLAAARPSRPPPLWATRPPRLPCSAKSTEPKRGSGSRSSLRPLSASHSPAR